MDRVSSVVEAGETDLGLTRLEIVSSDKGLVTLGKLDAAGHKRVLGGTVDKGRALEDGRDRKDGRGGDLKVRLLDRLE